VSLAAAICGITTLCSGAAAVDFLSFIGGRRPAEQGVRRFSDSVMITFEQAHEIALRHVGEVHFVMQVPAGFTGDLLAAV
jgi:hypothetical protein